ncbi:hypothetical protein [Methyloglobulus sp.]
MLIFFSLQATALEKCVINGKVSYSRGCATNRAIRWTPKTSIGKQGKMPS